MDRYLLWGVIGFAFGILLYAYFPLGVSGALALVLLGTVLSGFFVLRKEQKTLLLASVLLLGAALGASRVLLMPHALPDAFVPLLDSKLTIEGVVVVDPDVRETNQRLTIEVAREGEKTNVLVIAPRFPSVRYGEHVEASGTLQKPEPFETNGGRTFAYDRFLEKDGVFAVLSRASLEVVAPRAGVWSSVRGALSDLKFWGIDALSAALPEPHASLASGLLLGGKQGLGKDLLNDFITAGLVHIVVLSGYNVSIVADFVMRVFGFFSRAAAPFIGGFSILAFVLMAGAGPASVRAGIMAAIALYARATGRTYEALRALVASGLCMLLWNPLTLPYDPGFQLSFLATLGLIFGVPLLTPRLTFLKSTFLIEVVAATVCAQIAVLPLLLYQNGLFSMVALPANVLVLPLVPFAMLLSFIALIAGALLPGVAPLIAFPAYLVLSYFTGIVEFVANLPLAAISLPAFPFIVSLLAYAGLTAWVWKLMREIDQSKLDVTIQTPRHTGAGKPSSLTGTQQKEQ